MAKPPFAGSKLNVSEFVHKQLKNKAYKVIQPQVLSFHENWRGFFTNRIIKGKRMSAAEFDEIPTFEYKTWGVASVLAATAGPILGLLFFVLLLSIWSSRKYARYPVV